MAQYVVHKIGFFYDDDWYQANEPKGIVMGIFSSLEEAKLWKSWEDIEAMKGIAGHGAYRFVGVKTNRDEIYEKLEEYTKAEFGIDPRESYSFPKKINDEQAARFLSIMEITFHNIVEYGDDDVIVRPVFDENEDENRWF